ncbi:MAG TPA: FAD-dependent oxidoreductase [Gaiellaceae bacterium]|nr:FAD-dependent oxidoreductase [Gaiellaceae bacterium]
MPNAVVVGAGVFGASIARELAGRDWDVHLVEQYAPGTVRSASGGDTRLLRTAHGENAWYTASAQRARTLWLELQESSGVEIWVETGIAWFARRADGFEGASRAVLDAMGEPNEWLTPEEARRLYPTLGIDDLQAVLFEPRAGVLRARRATQLLVEDAVRLGVHFDEGHVAPADPPRADAVVWACGAWLSKTFPGLVATSVSRRDVYFFGGTAPWRNAPGWVDYDGGFYGTGDVDGLGVKVAPDFPNDEIDPDDLDRVASPDLLATAREYAARRFPDLVRAPVIGSRVCQYDLTGDTHFIADRHPEHESWWLVGGGSGHGFKHGPAFAEYVADAIEDKHALEPFHKLGDRTADAGLRTGTR